MNIENDDVSDNDNSEFSLVKTNLHLHRLSIHIFLNNLVAFCR